MTLGETVDMGHEITGHGGQIMVYVIVLEDSDADVIKNVHDVFERDENFFVSVDGCLGLVDEVVDSGEDFVTDDHVSLNGSTKASNDSTKASRCLSTSLLQYSSASRLVMKWLRRSMNH